MNNFRILRIFKNGNLNGRDARRWGEVARWGGVRPPAAAARALPTPTRRRVTGGECTV